MSKILGKCYRFCDPCTVSNHTSQPVALNPARKRSSHKQVTAHIPAHAADSQILALASFKNRRSSTLRGRARIPYRWSASSSALSISPTHLALALPVPPTINHQYATVNGRRVLSSTSRQYKASIAQLLMTTLAQSPQRERLLQNLRTHYLTLSICFYFTSALRRDVDGGLKIAQDALCDALEVNDNRIVELHLYKKSDSTNPRMEIFLSSTTPFRPSRLSSRTAGKNQPHR